MPTNFTAPGLRGNSRPQRFKIAEPSGCKSRGADRRVVNREQQTGSAQTRTALGVQVSPRRPFAGMPTGQANRACLLNSACLRASGASPRHSAILCALLAHWGCKGSVFSLAKLVARSMCWRAASSLSSRVSILWLWALIRPFISPKSFTTVKRQLLSTRGGRNGGTLVI